MRLDVVSLFPEILSGYVGQSILCDAIQRGLVDIRQHNLRDWAPGKHHVVDDRPFGGGPGMLLKAEPVVDAVEAVRAMAPPAGRTILLTPRGRRLDQRLVEELAKEPRLILVCGRYEGFDQRVVDILRPEEISIGDYVLGGGEVAAMVIVDAVVRLLPGVLGDEESNKQDSFSGEGWLEFPQYTRPRVFRGLEVPPILLSGDHAAIAAWRAEQSRHVTRQVRQDLLRESPASDSRQIID